MANASERCFVRSRVFAIALAASCFGQAADGQAAAVSTATGIATATAVTTATAGLSRSSIANVDTELRLETIGYRLSHANAALCPQPEMLTGLMLHNIGGYNRTDRPEISARYDLTYGFGVLHVVAGSAAALAGLSGGDEIVSLNGTTLAGFGQDLVGKQGSYDRTDRFESVLAAALRAGPTILGIRRGHQQISLPLHVEQGCGGQFAVMRNSALDAWSDGRYVAVTDRMMDFVSDDAELAFVVAHEMAHNILHHADQTKGINRLFAEFGFGARKLKAAEIEADNLAVELMARAGFDVTAPERLLRRFATVRSMDLSITHPGISRRIAIVKTAAARFPQV